MLETLGVLAVFGIAGAAGWVFGGVIRLPAWKSFWCRHKTLTIQRAHRHSDYARKNADKLLYIDRLLVHNFISCHHCGKVMSANYREPLFDDISIETVFPEGQQA